MVEKDERLTIRINKKMKKEFFAIIEKQSKVPSRVLNEFIASYIKKNNKILKEM